MQYNKNDPTDKEKSEKYSKQNRSNNCIGNLILMFLAIVRNPVGL